MVTLEEEEAVSGGESGGAARGRAARRGRTPWVHAGRGRPCRLVSERKSALECTLACTLTRAHARAGVRRAPTRKRTATPMQSTSRWRSGRCTPRRARAHARACMHPMPAPPLRCIIYPPVYPPARPPAHPPCAHHPTQIMGHPDPLVETASLAAVALPPPRFRHALGDLVAARALSDAQLETVVYASMRFEGARLPDGSRAGFFLGDGGWGARGWEGGGTWVERVGGWGGGVGGVVGCMGGAQKAHTPTPLPRTPPTATPPTHPQARAWARGARSRR